MEEPLHQLIRFAYLDPGTGSMVIQAIVGVVAGVGLFGRKALASVKNRMKRDDTHVHVSHKTEK